MPLQRMLRILTVILFTTCCEHARCQNIFDEIAAVGASVAEYCKLHGMNATAYEVVTSDNWVLRVYRIRSMNIYDPELSTPVLLSHGFSASSFDYMANLRNESLAFILADNGFDVWCLNYRANQFSNRKRVDGRNTMPVYSDYFRASWQEMADRDLPAVLDFIFAETKQEKLNLVGHSMGGTIPFAYFSQNHTYDDKIGSMELLAAVIKYGPDVSPMLKTVLDSTPIVVQALNHQPLFASVFGDQLMATQGDSLTANVNKFLGTTSCKASPLSCVFLSQLVVLSQPNLVLNGDINLNMTRMPILFRMYPGGLTMMTAYQFGFEWTRGDRWTKIDYSQVPLTGIKNIEEYGTEQPPAYNFSGVKLNYRLWYTDNDAFTGMNTANKIVKELKLRPEQYRFVKDLTHSDVVWAWNARCHIYDKIIEKFDGLEQERGEKRKSYRQRVKKHVEALGFSDGCVDALTPRQGDNILSNMLDRLDWKNMMKPLG